MNHKKGMNLIETIFIIVFLLILLAIAIPIGSPCRYRKQAYITTTKSTIRAIQQALTRYHMDTGTYPTTAQGLTALMEKPQLNPPVNWNGPYLQDYPTDTWNEDFTYKCPGDDGRMYDIISEGPTKSEEDNINSWEIIRKESRD